MGEGCRKWVVVVAQLMVVIYGGERLIIWYFGRIKAGRG